MIKKLKLKKKINNAIIGHSGYIGNELKKFIKRPKCYNSSNIHKIKYIYINNLYIAAPSSIKFAALKDVHKDLENIKKLILNLKNINAKKVFLFATIDSLNSEKRINEKSINDLLNCNSYGIFRGLLEKFCINNFDTSILRLPIVFNKNIKKNFLYDIRNKNYKFLPHPNSKLQFYNIDNLKSDLKIIKKKKIKKIHLVSEPIQVKKIYKKYLKKKIKYFNKKIIKHNLISNYAKYWGKEKYLYLENDVLKDINLFIKS